MFTYNNKNIVMSVKPYTEKLRRKKLKFVHFRSDPDPDPDPSSRKRIRGSASETLLINLCYKLINQGLKELVGISLSLSVVLYCLIIYL